MGEIKVLDVVALTEDTPKHSLRRGEVGTVVERWKDGAFEVEFSDDSGGAYAFAALPAEQLMKLILRTIAWSIAEVNAAQQHQHPISEARSTQP
jgi:hypothetical protein